MKHKLKTILTLAAVIIFCTAAFSQKAGSKSEAEREKIFAEGHLSKIKADTQLTAAQEADILKLLRKLYSDREKIHRQEAKGNKEKIGEKRAVHEVYDRQLAAVLTGEQRTALQHKADERRDAGLRTIRSLSDSIQTLKTLKPL